MLFEYNSGVIFKNTDRERKDLKRDVFEKMTAVMLALALAVSTLAGCGDKTDNKGEISQTVSEEGVTEDNSALTHGCVPTARNFCGKTAFTRPSV